MALAVAAPGGALAAVALPDGPPSLSAATGDLFDATNPLYDAVANVEARQAILQAYYTAESPFSVPPSVGTTSAGTALADALAAEAATGSEAAQALGTAASSSRLLPVLGTVALGVGVAEAGWKIGTAVRSLFVHAAQPPLSETPPYSLRLLRVEAGRGVGSTASGASGAGGAVCSPNPGAYTSGTGSCSMVVPPAPGGTGSWLVDGQTPALAQWGFVAVGADSAYSTAVGGSFGCNASTIGYTPEQVQAWHDAVVDALPAAAHVSTDASWSSPQCRADVVWFSADAVHAKDAAPYTGQSVDAGHTVTLTDDDAPSPSTVETTLEHSLPAAGGAWIDEQLGTPTFTIPQPQPHETYDHYRDRLIAAGLLGDVTQVTLPDGSPDPAVGPGEISHTKPAAGTAVTPDTDVAVYVNPDTAPAPVTVSPPGHGGIDWTPLTDLGVGDVFPIGIPSWWYSLISQATPTGSSCPGDPVAHLSLHEHSLTTTDEGSFTVPICTQTAGVVGTIRAWETVAVTVAIVLACAYFALGGFLAGPVKGEQLTLFE